MDPLSEATAIRLYNSVVVTDEQRDGNTQLAPALPTTSSGRVKQEDSVLSANEYGNSCRICRWNRSDMEILRCPCNCRGSVGFVHLQCLRRWILHRRDNRCEICNTPFQLPEEKFSFWRMLRTFMSFRCCGAIAKQLLFCFSLIPLSHVVLQQVLTCMDKLNLQSDDQFTASEMLMASCALLTSSALFFHFFEYFTTRFLLIRGILRQWWMFGNSSDFATLELETESFDGF